MKQAVLLCLTLLSCLVYAQESYANSAKDKDYVNAIVGDWAVPGMSGFARFKKGGGYFATIPLRNSTYPCVIEGAWWIKDGTLYNRLDRLTDACLPFPVKIGDSVTDTIVDIDQNKMTLIDDKTGNQYVKTKIQ